MYRLLRKEQSTIGGDLWRFLDPQEQVPPCQQWSFPFLPTSAGPTVTCYLDPASKMITVLPLPVDDLLPDLTSALRSGRDAVVLAPPGAGKTTRVPPALLRVVRADQSVVLLQPRRVAARAAASRIAEENGWRIGEEVGWQIRFERRIGARTRLQVLTEGILTRRIQSDPFLDGVGAVILDEFHERSLHTDIAIAMLREIAEVREDLRIVVMSATIDPAPIAEFLGDAAIFESAGRLFPVEVEYHKGTAQTPIHERAAQAIERVQDNEGDVLVFLPGMGEIRRTASLIRNFPGEVHVLHSSVSADAQDRAIRPAKTRKCVLSTNIAETSVTIDGVRTVIDSGVARVLIIDPRLGIERLALKRISRASATQRAGRAGRTAPGRCLRLWTREQDAQLEDHDSPEIVRVDLASTVLMLKAQGIADIASFRWFAPPRKELLEAAERLLEMLGAQDAAGRLTPMGRRMAAIPAHPRLARLLIEGAEEGVLEEAATMAALLSERDILPRQRETTLTGKSDLLHRMDLLNSRSPHVDHAAARAVERLRDQFLKVMRNEQI